jgi:hypothetical protein
MRVTGILLITLLVISTPGWVQAFPEGGGSFIGIFTEADALNCTVELTVPFVLETLYVVASINTDVIATLEAAVFKISGLPVGGGTVSGDWTSADQVDGPMETEITLQWTTPLPGPLILLGTIEFQPHGAGWLGDDHLLQVELGDATGNLAIRAGGGALFSVNGGAFTFNCTGICECSPSTQSGDSSWGEIKALY